MSIGSIVLQEILPADRSNAALAGRVWRPELDGPAVCMVQGDHIIDISSVFPTMRDLCEASDPAAALRVVTGPKIGTVADILANSLESTRDPEKPYLLAPIDLQAVKAAGVTFATSMLERVIEEKARGDASAADGFRADIIRLVGDDLSKLKPGSKAAQDLKAMLIAQGFGADAGLHPVSTWNNPEPEMVLCVASTGKIVGATLGNDVNLRDVEGRSALLLGKAKDNNASCALGPFLRFFDENFTLDVVREAYIHLKVEGEDGFVLEGGSSMAKISRDPADLVSQMIGPHHQYADGAVLFLGTMFAPIKDRDAVGKGFTHKDAALHPLRTLGLRGEPPHAQPCAT
eukprot:gene2480-2519_t